MAEMTDFAAQMASRIGVGTLFLKLIKVISQPGTERLGGSTQGVLATGSPAVQPTQGALRISGGRVVWATKH